MGDGDGLDGDELGLPLVLGLAVLAYVGWPSGAGRASPRKLTVYNGNRRTFVAFLDGSRVVDVAVMNV